MKKIIVYDEKYNNVKIIIQYSDYALTEKDVEKIVLKYYEENKKKAWQLFKNSL